MRQALLELVETKSFDQITILDITSVAGLSYPTFFRNYASKEDLLNDIAMDEILSAQEVMLSTFLETGNSEQAALAICLFVQGHRELWRILLTTGAASAMREEFIEFGKRNTRERGANNPELPSDLASACVASVLFETLAWWLRQPKDYPAGHVAQFLEHMVLKPAVGPEKFKLR